MSPFPTRRPDLQQQDAAVAEMNRQAAEQDFIAQQQKDNARMQQIQEEAAREAARAQKAALANAKRQGVKIAPDATGAETIQRHPDGQPVYEAGFVGQPQITDQGGSVAYRDARGQRYDVPFDAIRSEPDPAGETFYSFDVMAPDGTKQTMRQPAGTKPLFRVDPGTGSRIVDVTDPATGSVQPRVVGVDPQVANKAAIEKRKNAAQLAQNERSGAAEMLRLELAQKDTLLEPVRQKLREAQDAADKLAKEKVTYVQKDGDENTAGLYQVTELSDGSKMDRKLTKPDEIATADAWVKNRAATEKALMEAKAAHDPAMTELQRMKERRDALAIETLKEQRRAQAEIRRMEEAAKAGQDVTKPDWQQRAESLARDTKLDDLATIADLETAGDPLALDVQRAAMPDAAASINRMMSGMLNNGLDLLNAGLGAGGKSTLERAIAESPTMTQQNGKPATTDEARRIAAKSLGITDPASVEVTPNPLGYLELRYGNDEFASYEPDRNRITIMQTAGGLHERAADLIAKADKDGVPVYLSNTYPNKAEQPFTAAELRDLLVQGVDAVRTADSQDAAEAALAQAGLAPNDIRGMVRSGKLSVQDGRMMLDKLHGLDAVNYSRPAIEQELGRVLATSKTAKADWEAGNKAAVINRVLDGVASKATSGVVVDRGILEQRRQELLSQHVKEGAASKVGGFFKELIMPMIGIGGQAVAYVPQKLAKWTGYETEAGRLSEQQFEDWQKRTGSFIHKMRTRDDVQNSLAELRSWAKTANPGDSPPDDLAEKIAGIAYDGYHELTDDAAKALNTSRDTFNVNRDPMLRAALSRYLTTADPAAFEQLSSLLMLDGQDRKTQAEVSAYISAPRVASAGDVIGRAKGLNIDLTPDAAGKLIGISRVLNRTEDPKAAQKLIAEAGKIMGLEGQEAAETLVRVTADETDDPDSAWGLLKGGFVAGRQELLTEVASTAAEAGLAWVTAGAATPEIIAERAARQGIKTGIRAAIRRQAQAAFTKLADSSTAFAKTAAALGKARQTVGTGLANMGEAFAKAGIKPATFGQPLTRADKVRNAVVQVGKNAAAAAPMEGLEEGVAAIGEPDPNAASIGEQMLMGAAGGLVLTPMFAGAAAVGQAWKNRGAGAEWEAKKTGDIDELNRRMESVPGFKPLTVADFDAWQGLQDNPAHTQARAAYQSALATFEQELALHQDAAAGNATLPVTPELLAARVQLDSAAKELELATSSSFMAMDELRGIPEAQRPLYTAAAKAATGARDFTEAEAKALMAQGGNNAVVFQQAQVMPADVAGPPAQRAVSAPAVSTVAPGVYRLPAGVRVDVPPALLDSLVQKAPTMVDLLRQPANQTPAIQAVVAKADAKKQAMPKPGKTAPANPAETQAAAELSAQAPAMKALPKVAKKRSKLLAQLKAKGVVVRVVNTTAEAEAILGKKVAKGRKGVTQNVNGVPHVVLIGEQTENAMADTLDHEAIHGLSLAFAAENPELHAAAMLAVDPASPEFDAALDEFMRREYNGYDKLSQRQKFEEALRAIVEGRWKGRTSAKSKGFKKFLKAFLAYVRGLMDGSQNAALKQIVTNIENALQNEPNNQTPIQPQQGGGQVMPQPGNVPVVPQQPTPQAPTPGTTPAAGGLTAPAPTVINRQTAEQQFNSPQGIDSEAFTKYTISTVEKALKEGKQVTLITDGGKKRVPIASVQKGMMRDAEGNGWGTLAMIADYQGGVEITETASSPADQFTDTSKKVLPAKAIEKVAREAIGRIAAKSPRIKALLKESKKAHRYPTGGMWLEPDGKVSFHIPTIVQQLASIGVTDNATAGKRVEALIDEEIRHSANMEAARRLFAGEQAAGRVLRGMSFETWRDAWYGDIWNSHFTDAMRQAVQEAYGDTLPEADWMRAMEGLRMLDQLRATGSITEAVLLALDAILESLREFLDLVTAGGKKVVEAEIMAIREVLAEYGYEGGTVKPDAKKKPAKPRKKSVESSQNSEKEGEQTSKPADSAPEMSTSRPDLTNPEVKESDWIMDANGSTGPVIGFDNGVPVMGMEGENEGDVVPQTAQGGWKLAPQSEIPPVQKAPPGSPELAKPTIAADKHYLFDTQAGDVAGMTEGRNVFIVAHFTKLKDAKDALAKINQGKDGPARIEAWLAKPKKEGGKVVSKWAVFIPNVTQDFVDEFNAIKAKDQAANAPKQAPLPAPEIATLRNALRQLRRWKQDEGFGSGYEQTIDNYERGTWTLQDSRPPAETLAELEAAVTKARQFWVATSTSYIDAKNAELVRALAADGKIADVMRNPRNDAQNLRIYLADQIKKALANDLRAKLDSDPRFGLFYDFTQGRIADDAWLDLMANRVKGQLGAPAASFKVGDRVQAAEGAGTIQFLRDENAKLNLDDGTMSRWIPVARLQPVQQPVSQPAKISPEAQSDGLRLKLMGVWYIKQGGQWFKEADMMPVSMESSTLQAIEKQLASQNASKPAEPSREEWQKTYAKFKRALARAVKAKDYAEIIRQADAFQKHYEADGNGGFPDDWSTWERHKADAEMQLARQGAATNPLVVPILKPVTPPRPAANADADYLKAQEDTRAALGGLFSAPVRRSIPQLEVPEERFDAVRTAAKSIIAAKIRTPEAFAKFLDDTFPGGKARPYSEAIWDVMGVWDKSLRGTHDWSRIYGDLDQPLPDVQEPDIDETPDIAMAEKGGERRLTGPEAFGQENVIRLGGKNRARFLPAVWQMFQDTYRAIGHQYDAAEQLLAEGTLWDVVLDPATGQPIAFNIAKISAEHGYKVVAFGSDGGSTGKLAVRGIIARFNEDGYWAELSDAPAHIARKTGIPVLPAKFAGALLGKPVTVLDDSTYERWITGLPEPHIKTIFGKPWNSPQQNPSANKSTNSERGETPAPTSQSGKNLEKPSNQSQWDGNSANQTNQPNETATQPRQPDQPGIRPIGDVADAPEQTGQAGSTGRDNQRPQIQSDNLPPAGESGNTGEMGLPDVRQGGGNLPQEQQSTRGQEPSNDGPAASDGGEGSGMAGGERTPQHSPGRDNYQLTDPESIVGGGPKARFQKNKAALELLDILETENREPTTAELNTLAAYTGWGALGQELFQGSFENYAGTPEWREEAMWLRDRLGKDDWTSAQDSILNAHYTDPPTVTAMWDMIRRMGFTGGRVLEPSEGIGNVWSLMPRDLMANSQLTGIEMDPTTAAIAKMLHPKVNHRTMPYQKSTTSDNFYDVILGNWPFSNNDKPADRRWDHLEATVHNFFFIKALAQVRPGGLVVGITSTGTMDAKSSRIRKYLAARGELVAAFRLPSGAFGKYAGTKVVTDLIILRKREKELETDAADQGWVNSVEHPEFDFNINEYYLKNPSHVLGKLAFGHGTTSGRPGMIVERSADYDQVLARLPERLPEGAFLPWNGDDMRDRVINNTTKESRQNTVVEQSGELYTVNGESLTPLDAETRWKTKTQKTNDKRLAEARALIALRDAFTALMRAYQSQQDATAPRAALKAAYEAFRAAHGNLSDSFMLDKFEKAGDPYALDLRALVELRDGIETPRAIMERDIMRAPKLDTKGNIADAYAAQRANSPVFDAEEVAKLAGVTAQDVIDFLSRTGTVFKTPTGVWEPGEIYLSGNVRRKLREAEAAKAEGVEGMDANIEALRKIVPADVPYYAITTQMGVAWIPLSDYTQFIQEKLNGRPQDIRVSKVSGGYNVRIEGRTADSTEARNTYNVVDDRGEDHLTPSRIFQAAMNGTALEVKVETRNAQNEKIFVVDEALTKRAMALRDRIRNEFARWVWEDEARAARLSYEYNEAMNSVVNAKFDGGHLTMPGLALSLGKGSFDLRKHQLDAIWRGIVNRKGVYAHEVGTGKTFTMAGIAIEGKRQGRHRKPLLFAHNANSAAVAADFRRAYPGARILYLDSLSPSERDLRLRQIASDDWDAVIVPHSLIDRFGLKADTLYALARGELDALESEFWEAAEEIGIARGSLDLNDPRRVFGAINNARGADKNLKRTAKELASARRRIVTRIEKQISQFSKPGTVFFEDMGIDAIMVDEAHVFKKIALATRKQIKGLNKTESGKGFQLGLLTDYLKRENNGNGVHLFTGTPVTNTLNEVFNMMRFVMHDEMSEQSIENFDDWYNSYAKGVTDIEPTSGGTWEAVERLRAFLNIPELARLAGQVFDVVRAKDMPEFLPRPSEDGFIPEGQEPIGRPSKAVRPVVIEPPPIQKRVMSWIRQRFAVYRDLPNRIRGMLKKMGGDAPNLMDIDGKNAALDPRLVDPSAQDDPNSKVNTAISRVLEHYSEHPNATQMIFLERGANDFTTAEVTVYGPEGPIYDNDGNKQTRKETRKQFNILRDMVEKLVAQGVKPEEIAVFHNLSLLPLPDGREDVLKKVRRVSAATPKDEIAAMMNRGEVRIAFGGTETMGTGVNAQTWLRAMHHLDVPWMPGELEQRNGRGHRQGNRWNTVFEYRYTMEGTHDGKMWSTLLNKVRFIERFTEMLQGRGLERTLEGEGADASEADDEASASDFEQMFSKAAGDPRILLRVKMERDLEKLRNDKQIHYGFIEQARRKAEQLENDIPRQEATAARLEADFNLFKTGTANGFSATLRDKTFTERAEFDEAMKRLPTFRDRTKIGSFAGFDLYIVPVIIGQAFELVGPNTGSRDGYMMNTASAASMEGVLRGLGKRAANLRDGVEKSRADVAKLRAKMNEPFPAEKTLADQEKAYEVLVREIVASPTPAPGWLRYGAPAGSLIYLRENGRLIPKDVMAHRWDANGYWILVDMNGEMTPVRYTDAFTDEGRAMFEEQEFTEPPQITVNQDSEARGQSYPGVEQSLMDEFGGRLVIDNGEVLRVPRWNIPPPTVENGYYDRPVNAGDLPANSEEVEDVLAIFSNMADGNYAELVEPGRETAFDDYGNPALTKWRIVTDGFGDMGSGETPVDAFMSATRNPQYGEVLRRALSQFRQSQKPPVVRNDPTRLLDVPQMQRGLFRRREKLRSLIEKTQKRLDDLEDDPPVTGADYRNGILSERLNNLEKELGTVEGLLMQAYTSGEEMRLSSAPVRSTMPVFRRAKDFSYSGIYEVDTPGGVKRAFRDPETKAWLNPDVKTSVTSPLPYELLGWTKEEALQKLLEPMPRDRAEAIVRNLTPKERAGKLNPKERAALEEARARLAQDDNGSDPGGNVPRQPAGPRSGGPMNLSSAPVRTLPESPFYSKLSRVVSDKMPNRADVATIKGIITNPQTGIKAEELKWSGIVPWLDAQEGMVTKQAVLDYLASDGAVRLEEVRMGGKLGERYDPELVRQINEVTRQMQIYREDATNVYGEDRSKWPSEVRNGPEITRLKNEHERLIRLRDDKAETKAPKFAQYQLPGGENYREVVLAMPRLQRPDRRFREQMEEKYGDRYYALMTEEENQKYATLENQVSAAMRAGKYDSEGSNYTSSHFPDVPNYVAHARLNDRVDAEGRPGTFMEEIQSDRHQAGREKGYSSDPASLPDGYTIEVLSSQDQREKGYTHAAVKNGVRMLYANSAEDAAASATRLENGANPGLRIPDAPFRTTWPLQMFKRALAEAVAQGKQWIGWTTGDTQAERYDLSKQLSRISYEPNEDGTFDFEAYPLNDDLNPVISESDIDLKRIEELAGKEVAKKVEAREGDKDKDGYRDWHHLRGLNLRVGGEGMNGFYDTILPKEIGKYVKQWGAGVVKGGLPAEKGLAADQILRRYMGTDYGSATPEQRERAFRVREGKEPAVAIWRVDITPQMKSGVESGQALFSAPIRKAKPATTPNRATQAMRDIIEALPPPHREVLRDLLVNGMSIEDAATTHGISETAVGNILRRGEAHIRLMLERAPTKPTVQVQDGIVKATDGRPDLAMSGNAAVAAVDQRRMTPEEVTHAEMQDLATRLFDVAPAEAENLVVRWMDSGTTVLSTDGMPDAIKAIVNEAQARNAAEMLMTAAAKMLVARKTLEGGNSTQLARLIYLYRNTGTEQARALGMRRDPFDTPEERAAMYLSEALLTPPDAIKNELRRNPANRDRILAAWAKRADQIKAEMLAHGIDLDATFADHAEEQKLVEETIPEPVKPALARAPKKTRQLVKAIMQGMTPAEAIRAAGLTAKAAFRAYQDFRASLNQTGTEAAQAMRDQLLRSAPAPGADFAANLGLPDLTEAEWLDAVENNRPLRTTPETEKLKQHREKAKKAGTLDLKNSNATRKAMRAIEERKSNAFEKISEFWRASILSGPQTHVVNLISGLTYGAYEASFKKLAAGMQAYIARMFGAKPDAASLADVPAMIAASLPSIKLAFLDGIAAWKTETRAFENYALQLRDDNGELFKEQFNPALKGKLGTFMRGISFRLMGAADEFVKSFFTRIEVAAQARQIARNEGKTGHELAKAIQELMEPGSLAWERALGQAKKITFQTEIGSGSAAVDAIDGLAKLITRTKKGDFGKPLKGLAHFTFPFVDTPTNIFKAGVTMSPVGGLLALVDMIRAYQRRSKGNAEEAAKIYNAARALDDLTNQIVAWGFILGLSHLVKPGDDEDETPYITGTIPWRSTSPGERELAYRTAPPQSIRIGDRWISYKRLDPFASALAFTVDAIKEFQSGKPIDEVWTKIGLGMMRNMQDKTFLQGVSDVVNAVQDPERFGTKWATNIATGFVPNLIRQPIRTYDDVFRETDLPNDLGFWDALGRRMGYGIYPQGAMPSITVWGQPAKKDTGTGGPNTDWMLRLLSPADMRAANVDMLDVALLRYNATHQDGDPKALFGVTAPSRELQRTIGGQVVKISLDDAEYEDFITKAGKAARQAIGSTYDGRDLTEQDVERIKDIISRAQGVYRDAAFVQAVQKRGGLNALANTMK